MKHKERIDELHGIIKYAEERLKELNALNEAGAANDGNTLLADSYKLHWAIRLRKKLLIKGTWKWNAWVRNLTAWAEVNL